MLKIVLPLTRKLGGVPYLRQYFLRRTIRQTVVLLAKTEGKIFLVTIATVMTQQLVQKLLPKIYALPYFQNLKKKTAPVAV